MDEDSFWEAYKAAGGAAVSSVLPEPGEPEQRPEEELEASAPGQDPLPLFGYDLFGDPIQPPSRGLLSDRFEFPPFTVLNAREGAWQDRKRAWMSLGIQGELGRDTDTYSIGFTYGKETGNHWTSVFDPVLTELVYRWWCPPAGQIVDPFAGGSVRGIVAGLLGFHYHGIDLSGPQLDANEKQRKQICEYAPIRWVEGDSMVKLDEAPDADLIFSCPPYGDLERYSDDRADLSTMEYQTFIAAYRRIILRCMLRLRDDSFACFVVGDFRDKRTGMYRGFVADTINAFRDVGMPLYNDAILVTAVASASMRVSRYMDASRKLGKTHQNILVFAKGDPGKSGRWGRADRNGDEAT